MTNKFILPVFWALFGVFVVFAIVMQVLMGPPVRQLINESLGVDFAPSLFFIFGSFFFLLGLALIILTARAKLNKIFKSFLLLTGSSAVGVFVSILLHGVIYGLFILLFGEGFWDRIGIPDEPFFFMMAIFVCPLAYLVGTVGSIVLIIRRRKHAAQTV
ncbi:MAG: hypothetical protein H8E40_10370 [Chloroflexi bacterium]|nr:hypothetical protein [Chloroflexota bacterium]